MTIIREGGKQLTNQDLLNLNPDYTSKWEINLKEVLNNISY